jgi:hypothetical protein
MQGKFFILLILLFFSFVSCKEEQPPITPAQMASILSELHLTEAYAQLTPVDMGGVMKKNTDSMLVLYGHVYKKNNIDSSSFKNALDWYHSHPDQFNKVYEQVLEKLSLAKEMDIDSSAIIDSNLNVNFQDTL